MSATNKISSNIFASKILLFGEYTIIHGSKGLAFPFEEFNGQFKQNNGTHPIDPHFHLDDFCNYIQGSSILSDNIDVMRFKEDIKNGFYFDSNIPHGYGIGSSGALCAAIFARYSKTFQRKDVYSNDELKYLKDIMALMEGFQHGTSSGLDCLISLINKTVLIHDRNHHEIIETPTLNNLGQFYLYDSGQSRKTGPLVHNYLQRCEEDNAFKSDAVNLSEMVDNIINKTLTGDKINFKETLHALSHLQYLHFANMIPNDIKRLWLVGLETKDYLFKLCGAGGGGFFIVYSDNDEFNQTCDYTRICSQPD